VTPVDVEAAGGVVLRRGREGHEVLVVHRPRHADWSLPKGKLDAGEDHRSAAAREVLEETGVRAEVGRELPEVRYPVDAGAKRVRWFVMRADDDGATLRADDPREVDAVRWVPVADAPTLLTHELDRRTLAAALGADP
jgi:8-oxo-(d)GTP phosphatase